MSFDVDVKPFSVIFTRGPSSLKTSASEYLFHGHYEDFYSYTAGIDFKRQNLTSADVRF